MDGNFYQAGRYNYHLGRYYVCTNDPDMAEVYYYMTFLGNLDKGFTGALARIKTALDAWENDNLYGDLESLRKAREIIKRATERAYRDWWNPNFKGKESEKYEEAYEIIMTAVPFLMEAEREAWALEKERKKHRHFHFNIDGNDIYTDYKELFEAYTCVGRLAGQNPETFGEDMKLAGQNIGLWLRNITLTGKLNDSERTRAEYLAECFNKAVRYHEANADETETAFDMAVEAVTDISVFETNLLSKSIADPVEYEDTEAGRLRRETFDILSQVETVHRGFEGNIINITNDQEQKVLDNMKELIEKHGHNDLYLYRAALTACNNWSTMMLVRPSCFSCDLADAIDHYGSLAPEREIDWTVLQTVAEANPDMYFIEGMERLYDIICTAIEQGDDNVAYCATVVRDIIWEPENPIDED